MSDRHILIADPDPVQRQLIDLLLTDERTDIVAVDTARAVLEYLRSATPALIVIAHELPDLSGIAVAKRVKSVQRLARVPIIVTTAEPTGFGIDPAIRRQADEADVDLLLPKPLGDKALKERSRRLLAAAEAGTSQKARSRHHTTAVIDQTLKEIDDAQGVPDQRDAATDSVEGEATDPGPVLEELMALRDENALLKRRVASLEQALEKAKAEADDKQNRNRGLFGRRR